MVVGETKRQRLEQKLSVVRKCSRIFQLLGDPTLVTALPWLERLGATYDPVWWNRRCLSVQRLLDTSNKDQYASSVLLTFVGGPPRGPGHSRQYNGSLYTLILDRILYYVETVGLESTESVLGILPKA
jgi:hypothetical protein